MMEVICVATGRLSGAVCVCVCVCVSVVDTLLCPAEQPWIFLMLVIAVLVGQLLVLAAVHRHPWLQQRVFVTIKDVCLALPAAAL